MLPALHGELWKPNVNSLFRDNYNCFLAGKKQPFPFLIALGGLRSPWGCPWAQGWLQGGEVIQTQEYSSPKMRAGETFFWSLQPGLSSSKATLSSPWGDLIFFPITPGIPQGTLLLPELSALVWCVCPNKNTRENLYLQPKVCRDCKGVHSTSGQTQMELISQHLW